MIIDCHAHFSAPDALYSLKAMLLSSRGDAGKGQFPAKLTEAHIKSHVEGGGSSVHGTKGHLDYMDAAGTDMQLLSPRPYQMMHSESPPQIVQWFAEECNNVTHKHMKIWPDRFIGIASLPQVAGEPVTLAVRELERCVRELGFRGALLNPDPYENGAIDPPAMGDRYWYPLYEKFCELDVPAYIHGCSSRNPRQPYSMHFIAEETTAILGLLDSNVFTDFPSLKMVVSHGGGGVPYQIGRFEAASVNKTKGKGPLFSEKLRKLTFDTCLYTRNAIELLIKEVGIDNVVMGSECPGTGTAISPHDGHQYDDVAAYIRAIEWLTAEEKDKIFFKNAVSLFKLGEVKPRLAGAPHGGFRLTALRRKHDRVVVVGAGPVGSVAALLLARAGIPVTLLEREAERVIDYRASTFHPPTLDLLEECGATSALLAMGLVAPTMQYRDRQRGKIAEFDLSLLKQDTRHPYRLQCEQFKLVGWCYEKFSRIPGIALKFRHRVTGLAQSDEEVRLTVETPDGRREIAGDFVIACDGGRSDVRKTLAIPFEGFTYPEHFLVAGTRFDFRSAMPDICAVNYTADPREWYLLLQIPDMWRILLPVDPEIEPDDAVQEERVQDALQNLLPRGEPYEILVRAIYRVSQRVAATYRRGRAFLAGDAAHINNPLGGVGLNGGIHDAISLTRRLAAAWHGKAAEEALAGYEPQRRPVAIEAINAMTQRNKQMLEERDPETRQRTLAEWARTAGDPDLAYQHLLQTSMIGSLRRSGMI